MRKAMGEAEEDAAYGWLKSVKYFPLNHIGGGFEKPDIPSC